MGRWERTHESLRRAAWELFMERGYDATGTAQIAQRVGVSEVTLFRHYTSKEALLLEDPFDPVMAEAVRARPADETPMRSVAEGIRQAWGAMDADAALELRERLRLLAATPGLRGAIERNSAMTIEALVGALADRGVAEVQARVAATAVISGLSVALLDWAQTESCLVDQALDAALDVLGGK
ncbi:UNVERIFIED_ORG: AcrR family transcriptional regulator [Paenarthrobacter nicotinovorans]